MRILTVPGYTNSGPDHWHTLWEASHPNVSRVPQRDWNRPVRGEWVEALDRCIRDAAQPVILVAHSLGCATVAHWATSSAGIGPVIGAVLVAPADVDQPGWPGEVAGLAPMPLSRMALDSVVVASRDDPWVSFERASAFARAWGSRLVDFGALGHLDSDAGLGEWPAGWRLVEEMRSRWGHGNGLREGPGTNRPR